MAELGEGDRIFIFFSKQYLQSPYCMFEMSEMWRNSRQNKRELLSRVRFFFADTERISKPNDWIKHITFWIEERDELGRAIDVIGWRAAGEETLKRYWLMQKFVGELSNILSLFADVNNPRDMNDFRDEDLLVYAFGDLPRAPQLIRTQLDREPLQNI
jgi:internalin A